jgi:hypothetical protein
MPEKCYPCTWTILLPMYLDYTRLRLTTASTGAREAQFVWFLVRPFARPVMRGVRPLRTPTPEGSAAAALVRPPVHR